MPLYEYECKQCHQRLEKIQSFSAPHDKVCPKCGGVLERVISAPAIQFKGAGWYVNDYAKSGAKSKSTDSAESKAESKPEKGSDTSPGKSDSGTKSSPDSASASAASNSSSSSASNSSTSSTAGATKPGPSNS